MELEVWKDIKYYESKYQISNYGNVKSLGNDKKKKEKVLKSQLNNIGYKHVRLSKGGKCNIFKVHQLVAIHFLDHEPCGHSRVVNHVNFIKTDNRVCNLEIISQRDNANQKHIKSSSEYTGVYWKKDNNRWHSSIYIGGKNKHLGYFENEYDAHLAYQNELNKIKDFHM